MSDTLNDIRKKIDAYVKGNLSEEQIMDLWAEFARDPALLDELELEVGMRQLLNTEVQKHTGSEAKTTVPFRTRIWYAAAAVLLLVLLLQLFKVDNKTEQDQFLLTSISPDQLESADGTRNAATLFAEEADSLLNLGFNAAHSGRNREAMAIYDRLTLEYDRHPYNARAYINKGILLYNEERFDASITAFDSALVHIQNNPMVREKAHWFKANALVQTGQFEAGRKAAFAAYSIDGVFRNDAFELLQKLNYDLGKTGFSDLTQPAEK